jgi:MFS family permease
MAKLTHRSIAAAMTENLGSHPAWRSFFLFLIITTAVAFFFTVAILLVDWRHLTIKVSGWRPPQSKWSKVSKLLLRLDFFSFIWGSVAMTSLQFALHVGNTQTWHSYKLIPLFVAGFGLPSMFFFLLQSRQPAEMLPAIIPFRALSILEVVKAVCIALWGIGFYSFSYFTRKAHQTSLWHSD